VRGEPLPFSAETIGRSIKEVGLLTRQLGKAAKGLGMDLATMACVHEFELVWVYE
jgi:hypothetical protein